MEDLMGVGYFTPYNDTLHENFKSPFLCVLFSVVAYERPEGYVFPKDWDGTEIYCVRADIYDSTMIRGSGVVAKEDTISLNLDFESKIKPDELDFLDVKAIELMDGIVRNNEECKLKYGTMELPLLFCSYTYGKNGFRRGLWRV